ncbi:MAG: glycosyltransferase family 2 protein [Planctomycetes bacterium]|nr:glycosyltransferase family 2 protein [Planctomycetota bacterium]
MLDSAIDVSFVLPVYNEEECVEVLTAEIIAVMKHQGRSYEILLVNDCSTDRSGEVLERLAAALPQVRVLHHLVNSGESAAHATGFQAARGEIIVTLDADGQNDPASIPDLLAAIEGYDVAAGFRPKRHDDWVKRVSSKVANAFRNRVTGDRVIDAGCCFRALRRDALRELPVWNGMHRFLPTLLRFQGYRITEVPVKHRPRTTGVTKYGIGNRLWRGLRDCFAMRWYRKRAIPGRRVRGACGQEPERPAGPEAR